MVSLQEVEAKTGKGGKNKLLENNRDNIGNLLVGLFEFSKCRNINFADQLYKPQKKTRNGNLHSTTNRDQLFTTFLTFQGASV